MGYAEKNLVPGETILYRARYHWVFYRFSIIVMVLAAVLAVFAYRTKGEQAWNEVGWWLMLVAAAFAVLALASFAMLRFRANLDEFIVTNRRVIRKVGVVSREIQQAPLEKIQDITIEQGVLGRMLGFGTVIVETASEKGMIVFPSVAGPEGFRNHIWGQPPSRGDLPVPAAPAAQARLEELENLKQRGLVSPEEYAAKRQEILSHL